MWFEIEQINVAKGIGGEQGLTVGVGDHATGGAEFVEFGDVVACWCQQLEIMRVTTIIHRKSRLPKH